MKIVVVLFVFLLARSIIIHAEKEYSCSHVNATFGVPVGSVNCTGTFVSTVPLDACGEIKSNLTNSVALIIKNATSIGCSAAKQVYNVQQAGAIGAVVMNAPVSWYDDFEIVDAEDKDEYNITIPVVGILFQSGYQIYYMLKENSSITVTISRDFESTGQLVGNTSNSILLLWAGWFILTFFSTLGEKCKKYHRQNYVKQIKVTRFHTKNVDPESQPTCAICLSDFKEHDPIKTLRCGHFFHSVCIDPWLINEKALCPVCRQGIFQIEDWVGVEETR
ncbi:uncharacterized protein [Blastocystis hominis]|uniref:RING-type domain-containing protein n=1 Tax=Blastocystis hominis TaxID=12968 RepID=D8M375_BLAHO|nr:uncharacterized protein [Blastocystis hominis]CBK22348.2 unnamed protein product [Blastocystis hominis]|eukprot:XP_012896396.1 uncharacterized protein [Blastocystis hominis]